MRKACVTNNNLLVLKRGMKTITTWATLVLLILLVACSEQDWIISEKTPEQTPEQIEKKEETKTLETILPPSNLKVEASDSKLVLKWDLVDKAERYKVYQSSTPLSTSSSYLGSTNRHYIETTSPHIELTQLSNGLTYYYAVTATKGAQESAAGEISGTPEAPPGAPEGLEVAAWDSKLTLKWKPVTGATKYTIYRSSTKKERGKAIATPQEPSYADLGLTNDTTYYYAVTATKGAQESAAGEISGTPEAPPGAPEGLEVAAWDSKLTLKWKPVTGATKYTIYRSTTKRERGKAIATPQEPSYADLGLTNDTTYYYAVTATKGAQESAAGEISGTPEAPPGAPEGLEVAAWDSKLTLKWKPVTGATKYTIYRSSTKRERGKAIATPQEPSYADLGLTNDTTYYYAVTATKGAQESAAGEISGTPEAPPGAPEGLEVAAWDSKLTLKWKPVTGATKYTIYRSTTKRERGKAIATPQEPSYADLGLTNDTTYYYAVTATKGAQESAAGEISGTPEAPPGAPEGLEVAAWDSKLTLKWKPVTGATKYTIYRSTTKRERGKAIATPQEPSYADLGLTNDTTYYYAVTATKGAQESAAGEISGTPEAPPGAPEGLEVRHGTASLRSNGSR